MARIVGILSKILFVVSITALGYFLFTKADKMSVIYSLVFMTIGFLGISFSQMTTDDLKKALYLGKISEYILYLGSFLLFTTTMTKSDSININGWLLLIIGSAMYMYSFYKTKKNLL